MPELAWAKPPKFEAQSSSAEILRVSFDGSENLKGEYAMRILIDDRAWARSVAAHRHAHAHGVATTRVVLAGPASPVYDRAWLLVEWAPGAQAIDESTPWRYVVSALRRGRAAAATLAGLAWSLHQIPPGPAEDFADLQVPGAALSWLLLYAAQLGDVDLQREVEKLGASRPPRQRTVLCHGSLCAETVIVDGGRATIVDWIYAHNDDPLSDVSTTALLLTHPPVPRGSWLAPLARAIARRISRGFLARYAAASGSPIDADRFAWFERVNSARMAVVIAMREQLGNALADQARPGRHIEAAIARDFRASL